MLRIELKIMKICVHSPEFDLDLFQIFGPFADLHPAVEKLFCFLGNYCSGQMEAQIRVNKSHSEIRIFRLITENSGHSILLIVPFLETEQAIALVRAHAIELPKQQVAA